MDKKYRRRILRLFFIFFIFLFIILSSSFVNAAELLQISISDTVYIKEKIRENIKENVCTLGEIANINGPSDLTGHVGTLLLTIENGVITREQVIAALKISGLESVRIELKMPEIVNIEKKTEKVTETLTEKSVPETNNLTSIIKSLAAWDGEIEVQYRGNIPEGRLVAPASIIPGSSAATLRFRSELGRERSLAVRLTWTQPAFILTNSLKKGDIIRKSDLESRQIRINRPGVYVSKPYEVIGRAVRKNLAQGEPLTFDLITDVSTIERGKSVTIIVKSGSLVVKTIGEAMENGAVGDIIKVRNVMSKTVLSAVVVAADTVEVELP